MKIWKNQLEKHNNWDTCFVYEWPVFSNNLGIAYADISWRYPVSWYWVNHDCEQLYVLLSWDLKIFSWDKIESLQVWDAYYFQKDEKYFVQSTWCTIMIINSPIWDPNQFEYLK